ncbi:RICIN domain-containing protein, partial [Streptomyces sp. CRN 30]|uniref:RICIN domain-containing protein n=1 Tax=Streptomyces sp. CRN 30 TaxID=3075613 RepID=UPI002A837F78
QRVSWFGSKEDRPYHLAVQRSGVEPLDVPGTFVQRSFLPGWLATFLGLFLALTLAFVMIWIAYKPQVRSSATELQEAGVSTLAPSPSATEELAPPSAPAESPVEQPTQEETEKEEDAGGAGGDGGGGEASPSASKEPDILPASNVMLLNTTTNMCADIPGRNEGKINTVVQQANCHEGDIDDQMWDLEVKYPKGGPGGTKLFQIRNTHDQLCMDLPGYGAKPVGTNVIEFTCNGTQADNQLWWLEKQKNGSYWFRNFASNNKCLQVHETKDRVSGVRLTIHNCNSAENNPLADGDWRILQGKQDDGS